MTSSNVAPERMLPLYQGMMATFYNHRAADVVKSATATKRQNQPQYLSVDELKDPSRLAMPAYWISEDDMPDDVPEWLVGFSDITSPTNERTFEVYSLPRVAVGNKTPLIVSSASSFDRAALVSVLSSHIVDFLVRQKIGGTTMNYFYVKQFPVLSPAALADYSPWKNDVSNAEWLSRRVLILSYSSVDMAGFASSLGFEGSPIDWRPARRELLIAELDAACFHLYGIERDDVDYIMETFPIVKRKDTAAHGEFRTKRLILEIYDAMRVAIDTGIPYRSEFDEELTHG